MEEWRPAVGFQGVYSVSTLGNVRRDVGGKGARKGHILKATIDGRGYRMVDLFVDGIRTKKKVHVLVAETFIGERPEGYETRHLDGNCLNNAVSNLTYGTKSDNMMDAVKHGTHNETKKTHCKRGHEFTPDNTRIEKTAKSRRCLTCERNRRPIRSYA